MQKKRKSKPRRGNPSKAMALAFLGVGLLLLGGLALVLLTRSNAAGPEESGEFPPAIPQTVDFPAPELNLIDINEQAVSLADYTGKVVLVNNWAFWCPPCRAELPELQAYYEDHRSENFTIVGIEAGGEKEDVVYHVDLYKLTFPIWMDPKSQALRAFQNNSLPNSYVVDGTGTVRLAWSGPINREMLEKFVTPLLKEQ